MKKFLFIANAGSGSMKFESFTKLLESKFAETDSTYELVTLDKSMRDLSAFIEKQIEKMDPECVVACGGDGTVTAVGHALRDMNIPMAIIPLGTANIFAKCIGIPMNTGAAIDCLLAPKPKIKKLDAMECNGRLYFLHITLGLSALITYRTPQDNKRRFGVLAYMTKLYRYLNSFHRRNYTFTLDGKTYKKRVTEVVIANTDMFFSRPFRLGEDIDMNDGHLDILAFSPRSWIDHFKFMSYFTFGRPQLRKSIYFRRTFKKLHIDSSKPMIVHADGEIIGRTPIDVVLRPKILKVVTND